MPKASRFWPKPNSDKLPADQRFDLDLADVAEVWRRGSVISSWLLDLTSIALAGDAKLDQYTGFVRGLRRRPLDDRGGDRRGGAGNRALRRALRALPLAPRAHIRRQASLGDAARFRRPPGARTWRLSFAWRARRGARADERAGASEIADDAPARRAGAALRDRDFRRDGRSHPPPAHAGFVQSVALEAFAGEAGDPRHRPHRDQLEGLREDLTKTIEGFVSDKAAEFSADKIDQDAWSRVVDTIEYIDGDIGDPALYDEIKAEIDKFSRSGVGCNVLFYLAVAARFFGPVVVNLAKAGLMKREGSYWRRVIIEKPFGHDFRSAVALNEQILESSPKSRSSASTISSARRRCRTSWRCASATACSSRSGTATISIMCRSRSRRRSASRSAADFTRQPARCATWCRTICSNCSR